jgi:hypothetical protein
LFHGVLDLGDGTMAIMSEGPKGPHRDYQPGDKVGEFKLVAVNNEELVLEWEGQTITKKVDEILDRTTVVPPVPGPAAAAGSPAATCGKAPAAPGGDLSRGHQGMPAGRYVAGRDGRRWHAQSDQAQPVRFEVLLGE